MCVLTTDSCFGLRLLAAKSKGDFYAKAHLYEVISLLNHGVDEAVRGLERLKKAPWLRGRNLSNDGDDT
jgi:hypothetical protein